MRRALALLLAAVLAAGAQVSVAAFGTSRDDPSSLKRYKPKQGPDSPSLSLSLSRSPPTHPQAVADKAELTEALTKLRVSEEGACGAFQARAGRPPVCLPRAAAFFTTRRLASTSRPSLCTPRHFSNPTGPGRPGRRRHHGEGAEQSRGEEGRVEGRTLEFGSSKAARLVRAAFLAAAARAPGPTRPGPTPCRRGAAHQVSPLRGVGSGEGAREGRPMRRDRLGRPRGLALSQPWGWGRKEEAAAPMLFPAAPPPPARCARGRGVLAGPSCPALLPSLTHRHPLTSSPSRLSPFFRNPSWKPSLPSPSAASRGITRPALKRPVWCAGRTRIALVGWTRSASR